MTPDEYQQLAARTSIDRPDHEYSPAEWNRVLHALAFTGFAGEAAGLIKKAVFHRHPLNFFQLQHALKGASAHQECALNALPDGAVPGGDAIMLAWNVLGLVGEAGEVASHTATAVLGCHDVDRDKVKKELGDTLWYVAAVCTRLGLSLEEVMTANIEKLRARYPDGYSSAASIERADVGRD